MKKFAVLSLIVLIAVFGFGQTYDGWHNRTFEVSGIADIDTAKINVLNENLDADQKMISDIGTLATDSVISNSGNLKLSGAGTGIVENTDSLQINVAIVPDANDGAFLGTDDLNFQEINARQGDFDSTFVGILGENIDANQKVVSDLGTLKTDSVMSNAGYLILRGAGASGVDVDTLKSIMLKSGVIDLKNQTALESTIGTDSTRIYTYDDGSSVRLAVTKTTTQRNLRLI